MSLYIEFLSRHGVPRDEANSCMQWAFGEDYDNLLIKNSTNVWNKLHPEEIQLTDSMVVYKGMKIIAEAYLNKIKKGKQI